MQRASLPLVGAFALTITATSFLLFFVQPMIGKQMLPALGGSAVVWNTCLVFFQTGLLLAYIYAHLLVKRMPLKWQWITHGILVALAVTTLPLGVPGFFYESSLLTETPVLWLLIVLGVVCGPAYLLLAATSPLLQHWYHRAGGDESNPYALFAASNFGSLAALFAYPLLFEPQLPLASQTQLWSIAFPIVGVAVVALGIATFRRSPTAKVDHALELDDLDNQESTDIAEFEAYDDWETESRSRSWRHIMERAYWVVLALIPSSLMVATTTHITTDIAAVPMLWILPLSLYLLTFVIAFAHYTEAMHKVIVRIMAFSAVVAMFLLFAAFQRFIVWVTIGHLATFFAVALACHGQLVLAKPNPSRLTEFYLCLALGGALGGSFNVLVAPWIFNSIAEYPIAICLAVLLLTGSQLAASSWFKRVLWVALPTAASVGMALGTYHFYYEGKLDGVYTWLEEQWEDTEGIDNLLVNGIPATAAAVMSAAALPAAAPAIVGLTAALKSVHSEVDDVYKERTPYGVLRVTRYLEPRSHALVHGGILHGEQWRGSPEALAEPRSYYHRNGPLGGIMDVLHKNIKHPEIGAIGLGTGAIAAYGTPGNFITFFELDPTVRDMAWNRDYFTYLSDCRDRGCGLSVVIGDGRLQISRSHRTFDLIIVDAFSSDAIPIHLITQEAIETYFSKLRLHGMLAIHVSNRYVDLEPVLMNLADKMGYGYATRTDEDDNETGEGASTWVVLTADETLFDPLVMDEQWGGVEPDEKIGVWTDDFANLFSAFTYY